MQQLVGTFRQGHALWFSVVYWQSVARLFTRLVYHATPCSCYHILRYILFLQTGLIGLEPTTTWLTVKRSTRWTTSQYWGWSLRSGNTLRRYKFVCAVGKELTKPTAKDMWGIAPHLRLTNLSCPSLTIKGGIYVYSACYRCLYDRLVFTLVHCGIMHD